MYLVHTMQRRTQSRICCLSSGGSYVIDGGLLISADVGLSTNRCIGHVRNALQQQQRTGTVTLVFRRCSLAVEPVAWVGQGNTIPRLFTAPNNVSDCYWSLKLNNLRYLWWWRWGWRKGTRLPGACTVNMLNRKSKAIIEEKWWNWKTCVFNLVFVYGLFYRT